MVLLAGMGCPRAQCHLAFRVAPERYCPRRILASIAGFQSVGEGSIPFGGTSITTQHQLLDQDFTLFSKIRLRIPVMMDS